MGVFLQNPFPVLADLLPRRTRLFRAVAAYREVWQRERLVQHQKDQSLCSIFSKFHRKEDTDFGWICNLPLRLDARPSMATLRA